MSEFRLTQISDTHLGRRFPGLIANFQALSEHIDTDRPDLVVNTGDVSFDGPTSRDDVEFAKGLHDALPVACRYISPAITTLATIRPRLAPRRSRRSRKRIFSNSARSSARTIG